MALALMPQQHADPAAGPDRPAPPAAGPGGGLMRLYARVDGGAAFCLLLDAALLPEHLEAIAARYYRERWASAQRGPPALVLLRRLVFRNGDQLLEFKQRRRRSTAIGVRGSGVRRDRGPGAKTPGGALILSAEATALPPVDVYAAEARAAEDPAGAAAAVRGSMVTTNPPVPSLAAMCDSELMVRAATLERLVLKMTDPAADSRFVERTLLTTYRSFATPAQLLAALVARYEVPPIAAPGRPQRPPADVTHYAAVVWRVRAKVFAVLQRWVEFAPFDFSDDAVFGKLRAFARRKVDGDGMPAALLLLLSQSDRRPLAARDPPRPPGVVSRALTPADALERHTPAHVAHQLTVLTQHYHEALHPAELLGRQWEGSRAANVPNFVQYRNFVNRVSNLVSYTIVAPRDRAARAVALGQWLRVCEELYRLSNWEALVAVYGGVADPAVAQLTELSASLEPVSHQLLSKYEELLNLKGASKVVKAAMAASPRPRFPSIVVHLRDLVLLDGEEARAEDGTVNFLRCAHEYTLVSFLLDGTGQRLPFAQDPPLLGLLAHWPIVADAQLAELAARPPPEAGAPADAAPAGEGEAPAPRRSRKERDASPGGRAASRSAKRAGGSSGSPRRQRD